MEHEQSDWGKSDSDIWNQHIFIGKWANFCKPRSKTDCVEDQNVQGDEAEIFGDFPDFQGGLAEQPRQISTSGQRFCPLLVNLNIRVTIAQK